MTDKKYEEELKKDMELLKELEVNIEGAVDIVDRYFGVGQAFSDEINQATPAEREVLIREHQVCLQETLRALNTTTVSNYLKSD